MIFGTIETIFRSNLHEDSEKIGPGDRIEVHHVRFERFLWDVNTYFHWNDGYIHGSFLKYVVYHFDRYHIRLCTY